MSSTADLPAEAGTTSILRPTLNHPFYVLGRGWTSAANLKLGDRLRTPEGESVTVTDLCANGDVEPVFNLCVANHHTYFVSSCDSDLVLVHNESPEGAGGAQLLSPFQITFDSETGKLREATAEEAAANEKAHNEGRAQADGAAVLKNRSNAVPIIVPAGPDLGVGVRTWTPEECAAWFNSLPTKPLRTGNKAWIAHQGAVAGRTEYQIQGAGNKPFWADNIEVPSTIEAKMVEKPGSSPQLGTAPKFFDEIYRLEMSKEFGKIKSVIADPNNPITSVEVRVDTEASVPFWQSFLKEQGIPGRVVVGGKPGPALPDVPIVKSQSPGFFRSNAGAFGMSVGLNAAEAFGRAYIKLGMDVAIADVTNEECDPRVALQHIKFLREQFNEPRGVTYALWTAATGGIKDAQRQQREGNKWLDQMEQYWTGRQEAQDRLEVEIRASLPPIGTRVLPE